MTRLEVWGIPVGNILRRKSNWRIGARIGLLSGIDKHRSAVYGLPILLPHDSGLCLRIRIFLILWGALLFLERHHLIGYYQDGTGWLEIIDALVLMPYTGIRTISEDAELFPQVIAPLREIASQVVAKLHVTSPPRYRTMLGASIVVVASPSMCLSFPRGSVSTGCTFADLPAVIK